MTRPLSAAAPLRDPAIASPAMAQYLELKAGHPHALLFYRMGDFYEMFFEDAVAASAALDIALTKRGKHGDEDIAMCGVPVVQAERYLLDLTRKGFVVAVCEQMEDPAEAKKRGAKSVVRREVVRVVTPGTITEDALLEARASNHLAAYVETGAGAALAWMDISAGAPIARPTRRQRLGADLARIAPREILIPERLLDDAPLMELMEETGARVAPLGPASFEPGSAERRLKDLYGVATLEGFGAFAQPEISALGALADYLVLTQKGRTPVLAPPRREAENAAMRLDAATRRNLEILTSLSGQRAGGAARRRGPQPHRRRRPIARGEAGGAADRSRSDLGAAGCGLDLRGERRPAQRGAELPRGGAGHGAGSGAVVSGARRPARPRRPARRAGGGGGPRRRPEPQRSARRTRAGAGGSDRT